VSRNGLRPASLGIAVALAGCALAGAAPTALAFDTSRADVAAFIAEMRERHGFTSDELSGVLTQAETRPVIITAISRPAEKTMPWHEYRARFMTERRVTRGREVARDEAVALHKATAASGVPAAVLLGIVGVETFYGEITGKFRVIDALGTLAFDYEPRAKYFRGELEQFLLMTREESIDPLLPLGSYAGAMGIPQFMPTSFRSYAVDGGGDGHRDLWSDWSDVFASVGNYLKVHGWRSGEPVMTTADVSAADIDGIETQKLDLSTTIGELRKRGVKLDTGLPADSKAVLIRLEGASGAEYRVGFTNFYAITRYNRSAMYASVVSDLADAVQPPAAFESTSAPAASACPPGTDAPATPAPANPSRTSPQPEAPASAADATGCAPPNN
jgi:membrane-bound lytic murein transglycosylase B